MKHSAIAVAELSQFAISWPRTVNALASLRLRLREAFRAELRKEFYKAKKRIQITDINNPVKKKDIGA